MLRSLLERGEQDEASLSAAAVQRVLNSAIAPATAIALTEVSLASFDELLGSGSAVMQ